MKKLFTLVSAAVMAMSLQAQDPVKIEVDGLWYQLNTKAQTATLIPAENEAKKYEQESIVIPVSVVNDEVEYPVVELAKGAFKLSTASSIKFAAGSKVTTIGMQVFQRATNITELVLPEGIKLIPVTGIHSDQDPATEPMSLKKLVLPASVDSLAMMSVVASSLETIEFKGTNPPGCCHKYIAATDYYQVPWEINAVHKNFTPKACVIIVPDDAVEAYKAAPGIGDYFTNIVTAKETIEADGLWYELDNRALTATLVPAQNDSKKYEQEVIVIPATISANGREYPVVAVARAAFRQSTATSITFAEDSNVKEIGMQSFQRATNITELELPEGIKMIPVTGIHSDQDPATEPMSLKKLILPASVDTLAMMSVVASSLEEIEFKGSVPPGCCHKYIAATDYYQVPWEINAVHQNFTPKECLIIVPKGALEAYQSAPGIGDYFTTIQEKESTPTAVEAVENNLFKAGVYTITGSYLGEDATNLPAGMYIINGKKVIR